MEKIYQASTAEGAIDFINMRDLEIAAEEVIPKGGYGYISSGAGDIFTYQENERAFNHKLIIPHVLKDIELPDTTLSFGGDTLSAPIIMAPVAAHGLANVAAEQASAKGVSRFGTRGIRLFYQHSFCLNGRQTFVLVNDRQTELLFDRCAVSHRSFRSRSDRIIHIFR